MENVQSLAGEVARYCNGNWAQITPNPAMCRNLVGVTLFAVVHLGLILN
jgi:hypothetical protein